MASIFAAEEGKVFRVYRAVLRYRSWVAGGVPKDPRAIEGWLKSKMGLKEADELQQYTAEVLQAVAGQDAVEQFERVKEATALYAQEKHAQGFKRDEEHGLYLESRHVKATIKEAAAIVFATERWRTSKTDKGTPKEVKSWVAERVFVRPERIYLGRMEPDEQREIVGHPWDKFHKQRLSNLTLVDLCYRPRLEFTVHVIDELHELTEDRWARLWIFAQENGMGAMRSQDYDKFDIEEWERLS